MPTGAWAQTLVFGVYNERQELVTVSDTTVNWSAGGVRLPIVFIEDGGKYYRPEGGGVSYTSDDPAVATVDDSGYVTLKAYSGAAPIKATYQSADGSPAISSTFTVTVKDDRSEFSGMGVQFSPNSGSVTYSQSVTPTLERGQFEGETFTFSSSNPSVATVDASGTVTAVGVGNAIISAEFAGNDWCRPGLATYQLTVGPLPVTVNGITASNKTYDGTTVATLNYGSATFRDESGAQVSGVTVSSATGTFADANVGTGKTVDISGITLSSANYTLAATGNQGSTSADITPKPLTVTADAKGKTFGAADPALTYTATGLVGNDALTGSLSRAEGEAPGTYAITQGTLAASQNYTLTFTGADFTITAATMEGVTAEGFTGTYDGTAHGITVKAPEGATVKYGTAAGSYGLTASPTYTNVGESTVYYQVTRTGYDAVSGSATVKISPKALTVTADAKGKTFGAADPALTYTATGLVGNDALTGSLSRAEGEAPGTYAITQGTLAASQNYTLTFTGADFTITAATMDGVTAEGFTGTYDGTAHGITVNAPQGATVKYGTSEGSYGLTASPTYTNVGESTVYYQVTRTGYDAVSGSAIVKISPKALTVTADAKGKTFGTADPALTYTATGLVGNDALTGSLARAEGETPDTYAITQGTLAASQNYTLTFTGADFTITAATMDGVTAEGFTGTYDGTAHGITVKAPEGATVKYGTAAGSYGLTASPTYTNVGESTVYYQVTRTGYDAVSGSATVKISPKALTVTADAKGKTFGAADPALTYTATGLVGNDALTGSLSRAEGEAPGTYAITQGTLAASQNYTLTFTGADFTITAATMDGVTAEGFTGTYDGTPHGITVKAPQGATVTYGTAAGTYGLTASPTFTNVGESTVYYQVTQTGYDAVTGSATVKISPKPLTVTADAKGKTFGTADPALTYTATGLVGNDALTGSLARAEGETPDTYAITQGTLAASQNYTLTFTGADFTITAATMDGVTAEGFTGTYDGTAHGITVNAPQGATVTYGTSEGSYDLAVSPEYANAGTYTVYYQVTKPNYESVTGSADIVINKATGIVTFYQTTATATLGQDFTPPSMTVTPGGIQLTYESSDPSVATVDANTGMVTLLKAGYTRITASYSGDTNYTGASHYYDLTVEEPDLVLEPIIKEEDYEMFGADFQNPDGTDKDLSNTIINDILFTLKNQDSPDGDGYDSEDKSIVINTVAPYSVLQKLIEQGVAPGSAAYAREFTGLTFIVPAGDGFINIESQESNGYRLMVKVGDNAPVSIYYTVRTEHSIPYNSAAPTYVYLWNGGTDVMNTGSARTKGRKAVGNIRVNNVSYKAKIANAIQRIGLDGDDADCRWYDLNGHRIEKPLKKGIYIRNGRKVVIR